MEWWVFKRSLMTALVLSGAAYAQEAPDTPPIPAAADAAQDRIVYDAAFFAQYSPQNAADMVRQIPGFTLDEGQDRRGFSGAAGNVLIDGRRPSTKSQDLDDLLARIPAGQVARIELLRDASASSDAAGQSTLINIVRTPSAGAGVWEGTLEHRENGRVSPSGEASWTGRFGQLDYSVGVSRELEYYPLVGRRFFSDGDDNLTAIRTDVTPRTFREAAINGEATFPLLGGSMRVNGQIDRFNFRFHLDQTDVDPSGAPLQQILDLQNERRQNEELGFNFDRLFGAVSLELIGLATRGHYASDDSTHINDASPFDTMVAQRRRNEYAETIGRGTLSFPLAPAHRIDIGGEIAFNSLDAEQNLTVDENGSGPVAVALPAADVLVEEQRAEAFATWVWRAAPRWTLETTLAGEASTLSQSGDTDLETEFTFVKPSFQATRQVGERNQLRLRVYRDVDQLDFNDFVTSAGLADGVVVGGNPNLRPETSWRAEIAGDWRSAQDGAVGVRFFHYWLSDASDVVPVGPPGMRFDAPGNIGDGWIRGVQLTATIPLGFVLPGARLTLDNTWQDSEVTDPVIGRPRVISGFAETELEMHFRQDLPERRFAWGLDYYSQSQVVTFRLNEIDSYEEGPFFDIFAETTLRNGVKFRAYANNLLDTPFTRRRIFFDPDRSGAPSFIEDRRRTRHWGPFFGVTVSGAF
jgi:TonB dependent receptor/TonB-dependent Receptor Plug Domain